MSRTTLVIVGLAALVGLALAGGITLVSDHGSTTSKRTSTWPADSERAPEAEDHSLGELPAIQTAARRFLTTYLRVVYGKGSLDDVRSATPQLIAELRTEGGHVTPAQQQRTPKIERVTVIRNGPVTAQATGQITDAPGSSYPLSFHLEKTTAGWLVTRIGGP